MFNTIINYFAFSALSLLWLAFGAAVIFNPTLLNTVWTAFRGFPLLAQGGIALFTLPVTLGLWIWETSWPVWLRLVLVLGLAWVTIYTFFPRHA